MGVEQAAEHKPVRSDALDELADVGRAAHMSGIEKNVLGALGDVERQLAVRVGRQRIQ